MDAILALSGILMAMAGGVLLTLRSFEVSPWWGTALAAAPFVAAPCFALRHWKESRLPMALHYAGVLLVLLGRALFSSIP